MALFEYGGRHFDLTDEAKRSQFGVLFLLLWTQLLRDYLTGGYFSFHSSLNSGISRALCLQFTSMHATSDRSFVSSLGMLVSD